MTTPQAVPFTFDTTFDQADSTGSKRTQRRTMTQAEIDQIERAAFAAGAASTHESQTVVLTRAVGQLMDTVIQLEAALRSHLEGARAEATQLAYITARKLAETLVAERPAAEIQMLIGKCLEEQKGEAAIVLRVNEKLHDQIRDAAADLKTSRGFEGRIVVIGEPQIAVGDCAIEWADGGLERDLGRALRDVESVLRSHVAAESDKEPDLFNALVTEMDRQASERT